MFNLLFHDISMKTYFYMPISTFIEVNSMMVKLFERFENDNFQIFNSIFLHFVEIVLKPEKDIFWYFCFSLFATILSNNINSSFYYY